MSDISLDDQLKLINIEKAKAEAEKLKREMRLAPYNEKKAYWADVLKVIGGLILGAGGVITGYSQVELAEWRVKVAKGELAQAQSAQATALKATTSAKADLEETQRKKMALEKELTEKAATLEQLKVALTNADHSLRQAQPDTARPLLTYLQFQGSISREWINELREHLKADSFNAPGAERVAGGWTTEVKFFSKADQDVAQKLARSVDSFLAGKNCSMKSVPVRFVEAPPGQVHPPEVWLSGSCK